MQRADILGLSIAPKEKERHRDRIDFNAEYFKRILSVWGSVLFFSVHSIKTVFGVFENTNHAKRRPNKNIGTVLSNGEL